MTTDATISALRRPKRRDLHRLSKNELIDMVLASNSANITLNGDDGTRPSTPPRVEQPFNYRRYCRRPIALQVAYLGWSYDGLAIQESAQNTIEHHLFEALKKTRLCDDVSAANYQRCGRTDKGVSALNQVLSLLIRTNMPADHPMAIPPEESSELAPAKVSAAEWSDDVHELKYARLLNRVLPEDIRVLGWAPVPDGFSARFQCKSRSYKYFFPRQGYNVDAMNDAARRLQGTHDYRNFCKIDTTKGTQQTFMRRIIKANVETVSGDPNMMVFNVKGSAFLWHQVRCMMAVLFLVGSGQEQPDVVTALLDIDRVPLKPGYTLAPDAPLVLWDSEYDPPLVFKNEASLHENTRRIVDSMLTANQIKSSIMRCLTGPVMDRVSTIAKQQRPATPMPKNTLLKSVPTNVLPLAERLALGDLKVAAKKRQAQEREEDHDE